MAMKKALEHVNDKILAAVKRRQPNIEVYSTIPRLVAVSKFKPISAIVEAYEYGQRYFGENYIQELVEKSNSPLLIEKCPEIKFHFIGHLQSNKTGLLLRVRNLDMVETIDSTKLANLIDKSIAKQRLNLFKSGDVEQNAVTSFIRERLNVMIQVNVSDEPQKNGVRPNEASSLAEHIIKNCNHLNLVGLMMIGSLDASNLSEQNQEFKKLFKIRQEVAEALNIGAQSLELSMGMSNDFEEAILEGSSNIRVGSLIFGERDRPA